MLKSNDTDGRPDADDDGSDPAPAHRASDLGRAATKASGAPDPNDPNPPAPPPPRPAKKTDDGFGSFG